MLKQIRTRLSYQLLFNIVMVFLFLILITSAVIAFYVESVTKYQLVNRVNSDIRLATREIELLFENAAIRALQLSLDTSVQTYLKEVKTREDIKSHPLHARVLDSLKSIAQSDKDIFLAWVANEKANFYLDSKEVIPDETYRVAKRPWYSYAMNSQEVAFTAPYIEWVTKELVVTAILAKRYTKEDLTDSTMKKDEAYGFTAIDFMLSSLPKFLDVINVGEKGHVIVVDKDGFYITDHDKESSLDKNIKNEDVGLKTLFLESISDESNESERNPKIIKVGQRKYYAFNQQVEPMGWTILCLLDYQEMRSELQYFLIILISGTVLFIVIVGFILQRLIAKKLSPIEALTNYANAIANGNLDEEPPYAYASRFDEMGNMSRAFVTITEVFRQQNRLLEDVITSQYQEIQQQYKYILEKEKIASLGTLVAGVAHEINTPLGIGVTTSSYIERLIDELTVSYNDKTLSATRLEQDIQSLKDASGILSNNLQRAADLVTQFKAVSTNQNISELASMHLFQELENVISSLKPTFKYRKVKIVNQIDRNVYLDSFAGAFNQIFTNLIINSMHHAFDEDQEGIITIQGWAEGNLVRIIYQDNGKGIGKDVIDHMYEPFYTTRRSGGNSGLGMYITHNLVTQTLSGTLHVDSVPGYGVKFMITVPMHLKVEL